MQKDEDESRPRKLAPRANAQPAKLAAPAQRAIQAIKTGATTFD
jgi:hypothetical protein